MLLDTKKSRQWAGKNMVQKSVLLGCKINSHLRRLVFQARHINYKAIFYITPEHTLIRCVDVLHIDKFNV